MIAPDVKHAMAGRIGATTRVVPGGHAVYIANPRAIADLIEEAVTDHTTTTS